MKKVLISILVLVILLYVGSYALFRTMGYYQWWHIGETRSYMTNDPRLIGNNDHDLVMITPKGSFMGTVAYKTYSIFQPVANIEHRVRFGKKMY